MNSVSALSTQQSAMASHVTGYMAPQHDGNMAQQQSMEMPQSTIPSIQLSPTRAPEIRNALDELKAEREALDPAFAHCIRLIDEEINKLEMRNKPSQRQEQKVYISFEDAKKYNLVGRLLGPKGLTLKRIQGETQTKMSILGRGSIRDRNKEEELRNSGDPTYAHLSDELHVLIESIPPGAVQKLAAGIAEVRKMLIPPEPGQPDFASKYDSDMSPMGPPPLDFPPFGGRGGGPSGRRGPPRGGRGGRGGGGRDVGPMRGGRGGGGRGGPPRGRGGPPRGGGRGARNSSRGGGGGRGRFDGPMSRGPPPPSHGPPESMDYKHGYRDGPGDGYQERHEDFSANPTGGDSFYSSFSDTPSAGGGGGMEPDWMGGRHNRRDNRPHPYY